MFIVLTDRRWAYGIQKLWAQISGKFATKKEVKKVKKIAKAAL